MVNIIELQALVRSLEYAAPDIRTARSTCENRLAGVCLTADRLHTAAPIATWVEDQIVMTRRMLAYARRVAEQEFAGLSRNDPENPPVMPNGVSFDEADVPHDPPALARRKGRQAAALLTNLRGADGTYAKPSALDVRHFNELMADGSVDPYFAAAFARGTTPTDYQEFMRGMYPDVSPHLDGDTHGPASGISLGAYDTAVDGLAGTISLATRGTGDLQLPSSWNHTFINAMLNPGSPEHPATQRDVENTSSLLLVMSKGDWSTPFLDQVQPVIARDVHDGQRGWAARSGLGWMARDGHNSRYGDQAEAFLTALARNPEAAEHAFSRGPSTSMPFPEDRPKGSGQVNQFMYDVLTGHWYMHDDPRLATDAITAATVWDPHGGAATAAANFTKSATQAQHEWDSTSAWEKYHHIVLGALSFLPVAGIGFAAADTGFYAAEGDWADAAFSLTPAKGTNGFQALSKGMRLAAESGRIAETAQAARWEHLYSTGTDASWAAKSTGAVNSTPPRFYTQFATATDGQRARIEAMTATEREAFVTDVNNKRLDISSVEPVPGYNYHGLTPEAFIKKWSDGVGKYGPNWKWPPNDGFDPSSPRLSNQLRPGDRISRISFAEPEDDAGKFATDIGTTSEDLAIPPDRLNEPFKERNFVVLKDLPSDVTVGRVAPWFGQPGNGIQYHFPEGFQWYIENHYIKEVP